jgi:hypothetical protein
MPDPETFDAFYARTVWNVTSQMHELTGDDGLADHAIREAYAKAYQQWYQVSGYRDTQAWVLAAAKDAYERRRAEPASLGNGPEPAGRDSGTWPGFFRPPAKPARPAAPGADPAAAVAAPRHNEAAGRDGASTGLGGILGSRSYPAGNAMPGVAAPTRADAAGPPGWHGPDSGTAQPTHRIGFDGPGAGGPGAGGPGAGGPGAGGPGAGVPGPEGFNGIQGRGGPGRGGPGRSRLGGRFNRPGGGGLGQLGSRRNLIIAGVAVAAVAVAFIAYGAGGGHKTPAPAASGGASARPGAKPKPHMLAAGRTGSRSAVPWSLVGRGWALAEFSTAAPNSAGQASGGGSYTTYLVDPEGGKYEIATSSGGTEPALMAWSGDAQTALFGTASGDAGSYQLLNVRTGQLAQLPLPAGVVPVGFARPLGTAILALRQGPAAFRLQRYTLTGQLQTTLALLPRKLGESLSWNGCGSGTACAISSPEGLSDVWGIAGREMQVLSNAGGKVTRLHVKDSGKPPSCVPVSWWNDSTILADCAVGNLPDDASRLWLIPEDGATPTALTQPAAAGVGHIEGAWLAGQTYVTSVTSQQCQSAPSGTGGMDIVTLSQGTNAAVTIPRSTGNFSTIVATLGKRLLVLAQTRCPGTSSLLWFNPSTGHSEMAISAPSNEVGVIAAVPFGNGPTANTAGQY